MKLLLVGMNHRTAPLAVRERYAVDDAGPAVAKLVASRDVEEAVVLSTCNRVEVLVATREPAAAELRVRSFIARDLPGDPAGSSAELENSLYVHRDAAAIRHVMRVACSVDSMVVGEPQILGQVKDAYRAAVDAGACGAILGRLYQRAFATAKRVRNETGVADRPVSVARVAADLARQIFESLDDKSALLVGAGEMIELAVERLQRHGLERIRVANRTPARAADLASRVGGTAHGLDEIPGLLVGADVVLTCIGGSRPIIGHDEIGAALRRRRGRPIFAIDIGVPRNIDPRVDALDGLFLYDLDDLSGVAEENAEGRRREALHADAIVLEEQQRFEGWMTALAAVPTIRALRTRAERIRAAELDRILAGIPLDERQQEAVEAVSRGIVNKLLHAPLSRLRAELESEEGLAHLEAARTLFALDDPEAPGATGAPDEVRVFDPEVQDAWSDPAAELDPDPLLDDEE